MTNNKEARVSFNLPALKRRLESSSDRDYTWKEIATGAGIHPNTLTKMVNNKTEMVQLVILQRLLMYFRDQGVTADFNDLLVFTEAEKVA